MRMLRSPLVGFVLLASSLSLACGSAPASVPPATAALPVAPVEATPAHAGSQTVAPPSTDDGKKAAALRQLQEDRAQWQEDSKAELARWTPELHAQAAALAGKTYPSLEAAMKAVLASKVRKPGDADRDKFRHPLETLAFFGLKPSMTVIEVGPGEGWFTELLAPTLAAKGKLVVTGSDPNGPPDTRGTFYGQRWKAFLDKSPELFGKVQTIVVDGKAPSLAAAGAGVADMVIVTREVHGMVNGGTLGAWLTTIRGALKPGGVLGIEEHRAPPDADPVASSKKGYVPEKWLIAQVEAAGFKLAGKSEVNANPKDTKDYAEGVWTLPPTLTLKDKDRDKYVAIGESDRMTLRFVRTPDAKK
jgi:predicted methyltransferase